MAILAAAEKENRHQPLKGLASAGRIRSIDTMRGAAMALVIYAHIRIVLNPDVVWPPLYQVLVRVSSIASITFMFISGTMISYFLFSGRSFRDVYTRYTRRALLLLACCHVLIRLSAYPTFADSVVFFEYILLYFPITDTIALCLLLAPFILIRTGPKSLMALILILLIVSPVIAVYYQPDSILLKAAKEFLFGQFHKTTPTLHVFYPLFPWLAVFLCGSYTGRRLAQVRTGKISAGRVISSMRRRAVLLIILSIILTLAYKLFKGQFAGIIDPRLFEAFYPTRTTALLPAYLAAIWILFSFLVVLIDEKDRLIKFSRLLTVFGRTSLFTYVSHYLFAWSIPALLGWKQAFNIFRFIPILLLCLAVCWITSYAYARWRGWLPRNYISRGM